MIKLFRFIAFLWEVFTFESSIRSTFIVKINNEVPSEFPSLSLAFEFISKFREKTEIFNLSLIRVDYSDLLTY